MGDEQVGVRAVLVVPLAPATGGNGLAMRAGLLLEALAADVPVDVVVVPVSGPAEAGASAAQWLATTARRVVTVEPAAPRTRTEVVGQLGDPAQREELLALQRLPSRARLVAPSSAASVAPTLGTAEPTTVVVLRSYLAPFGVTLARHLGAARVVVDADDDDERLARDGGEHREADAYGILAREWLSTTDRVVAASPVDADAMTARYGFTVDTLPNAVRCPPTTSELPGRNRLLYVGNLTYAPNVDAVRTLVDDVLPLVRAEIRDATVAVVGAHDERLDELATLPGVELAGAVGDLAPWYDAADVVVVPLHQGAGTRLKLLEAFAHRRPVVGTPAAVAGLAVADGRSVHLGVTAAELAAHVVHLLRTPGLATRTVDEAEAVLAAHYLLEVVAPQARRLLIG